MTGGREIDLTQIEREILPQAELILRLPADKVLFVSEEGEFFDLALKALPRMMREISRLETLVSKAHSTVDLSGDVPKCGACDHTYSSLSIAWRQVLEHMTDVVMLGDGAA